VAQAAAAEVSRVQLHRRSGGRAHHRGEALVRFKARIRDVMRRTKGVSIERTIAELAPYMRGWCSYFDFCETPVVLQYLTRWVRLRLRTTLWRQWKAPRRRRVALIARWSRGTAGRPDLEVSMRGPVSLRWLSLNARLLHTPHLAYNALEQRGSAAGPSSRLCARAERTLGRLKGPERRSPQTTR
jgi:hypothetical protein